MTDSFFGNTETIKYEGPETTNPMAFRHYDPSAKIFGKTIVKVHLATAHAGLELKEKIKLD